MDLKNKHLEHTFCLGFLRQNFLNKMVFDVSGTGGAGGARQETGPVAPDKKDTPPETSLRQRHDKAEAATKGESRAERQEIRQELSPEATQGRLDQITARQTEVLKKKEATAAETKKTIDTKEPWVNKPLAIPENQPYKAYGFDITTTRIAQNIEGKMSEANYAALLKDLMPQDMPLTAKNKEILRNLLTAMVDSYLHHENPDTDTAQKYGKEVLLPRFENFLSAFQKLAGKEKPIKVMIEFSAFLAKVDPTCNFMNKDGVIQPGIQNVLQVSDPAKLLDLFTQDRQLEAENISLAQEKLNVEAQKAITQNQTIDIAKKITEGELKFTSATFTLPTDPAKIDEALKTELDKTIGTGLIAAFHDKALEYLIAKAQSLKEPGAKLSVAENGEITLITPADEEKAKQKSEQEAQKSQETAAQLSGNPTVKEGIQDATENIGVLLTKFFQVLAESLKKLGLTFDQLETLNFDQALKKWSPPPTEKETTDAKGFYETIKKAAPKLNKSFEGLLADPVEMRKILKNKPENMGWQAYLFNSENGHVNKTELAQLQDSNKQLKPAEISAMILSEKGADEEVASEQAHTPVMTQLSDKSFAEMLFNINIFKSKFTAQDVEEANQILGNDAESIKKNMSKFINHDNDKFSKFITMSLDPKSGLNPKIREYIQRFIGKMKEESTTAAKKILEIFPDAFAFNGFTENIKKQPDWPNYIKEQLKKSKEFRIKSGIMLVIWKKLAIENEAQKQTLQTLEKTIDELKLDDQIKKECSAVIDFDQIIQSLENEFPELSGAIMPKRTPADSAATSGAAPKQPTAPYAPEIVTAPKTPPAQQ